MHVNRSLRAIAAAQWGYFTAVQAASAGYSKDLQGYHARSGNWTRVDRGLYRLPNYTDALEAEFTRYSLWALGRCPQRQIVVSHSSALYYHGLGEKKPSEVELTVSALRSSSSAPGCRLYVNTLSPEEYLQREGFCITSPLRTLQDMRPDLSFQGQWLSAIAKAWEGGLLKEDEARTLAAPVPLHEVVRSTRAQGVNRAPQEGKTGDTMLLDRRQRVRSVEILRHEGLGSARSFTLVEMLVVVAIMVTLSRKNPVVRGSCSGKRTIEMSITKNLIRVEPNF